ncbi:MAG: GNAT family N-acetyltransferase, partial [Firmicutes bacterium]|nr:GNAT family N-acetyltransferase [Bacillota bacterium]
KFIGRVNIRHRLVPHLEQFGGHIGYMIRPTEQGKGYGRMQLAMALDWVRENLDLDRVLVTCDDDNIRSARVIEANGGVLENKVENFEFGKTVLTRRYWIEL